MPSKEAEAFRGNEPTRAVFYRMMLYVEVP